MKRKVGLFLIFAAALPLAATSIAWACGVLATAKLDKTVAAPGEAVTLTGRNYSTAATASAVTVRLSTRSGRTLGGAIAPDPSGRISSTFSLPADLSPGYYVINVLQFVNGNPKAGTPGRSTIRVQGTAAAAATPWGNSTPSGPSAAQLTVDAAGGSLAPMLAAIALSLAMLAGGWTLVARKGRSVASSTPLAT